jgi:3-phosphoglycerate kinase
MKFLSKQNSRVLKGKICLLRIDLNIEPSQEKNTYRVEAVLPTIRLLLKHGIKKIVLLSHRGRPVLQKEKNLTFSLSPFAPIIAKRAGVPVDFIAAYRVGGFRKTVQRSTARLVLLGNLRFFNGEETNDPSFARELAKLGDFYVNDAFTVSHRKNASVVAITKFLPSYAGLLLEKEIKNLDRVMKSHRHCHRPFTVIIGGAKVSDKIGVIKNFWNKADYFLLGGGPANTFFAAQGLPIGDSLVDRSMLGSPTRGSTSQILKLIRKEVEPRKIVLPLDVKIKNRQILDIGEQTVKNYSEIIKKSKTIIWNGPMGLFEKKGFGKGTLGIWKTILANRKACIVVGGGETVASLQLITHNLQSITKRLSVKGHKLFVSTGGGAMLEYLSGKKLPGLEALN